MKKNLLTAAFVLAAIIILIFSKVLPNDSRKYEKFLTQNYSADNIKVIMADLTHDNHDEMIVLERLHADYFTGLIHIFHISDAGDIHGSIWK